MPEAAPIAVVVPAYNAEAFLAEAIQSVFAQSLPVSEIIVVDDGSTDQTVEIAGAMGARVLRQEHSGVSVARNFGIRTATQPWIAFLDADDTWEADKIAYQWAAIQRHPATGMVSCDVSIVENGQVLASSCVGYSDKSHMDQDEQSSYFIRPAARFLIDEMNYFPSAAVIRREALLAVGLFDERLHYNEDFDCFMQVLATWPLVMVGRPLVWHRRHGLNTSSNTLNMALSYTEVVDRMHAQPGKYPQGAAGAYEEQVLLMLNHTGRLLLAEGRRRDARVLLGRLLRTSIGLRALLLWGLTWLPDSVRERVRLLGNMVRRNRHA